MSFLLGDIQEKEVSGPRAPSLPPLNPSTTGFPEPKKRRPASAFKQKRHAAPRDDAEKPTPPPTTSSRDAPPAPQNRGAGARLDKQGIDRENSERLASMSAGEIDAAREELFSGLDPSVLQMLLRRANLDAPSGPSPFDDPAPPAPPEIRVEDASADRPKHPPPPMVADEEEKEGSGEAEAEAPGAMSGTKKTVRWEEETADDHPSATGPPTAAAAPPSKPHWPRPPQPAADDEELDLADPDFLAKLHAKYFPTLAADPAKLAWMAPVPTAGSAADRASPYHPGQGSVAVAAVRFDFRGRLVPPRAARAVPATRGLHHHGEAPEAAGYTVPELARLARSAVPGQRCVAYRALGRLLYRLGAGEFGGPADPLAAGLWALAREGAVLRSLGEEAGADEDALGDGVWEAEAEEEEEGEARGASARRPPVGRRYHRSARAYAIEALWLYEKGGWKERLRRGK
ncbi:RPAP1-like protein [Durotheca rogersii]|uniref:RPAP1-like protein n=1 Tax=Durotheca rogersii TaxID=419775 RepID=UPI0022205AC6|nr:RPAP1-like protein [Durotheca rogersii]KAI5863848.1 RPAP1-like protein [Durotheca rogersii]